MRFDRLPPTSNFWYPMNGEVHHWWSLQSTWRDHKRGCLSSNMFPLNSNCPVGQWRVFSFFRRPILWLCLVIYLPPKFLLAHFDLGLFPRYFNCNGRMRYLSSILGVQKIPRSVTGGFNPMVGSGNWHIPPMEEENHPDTGTFKGDMLVPWRAKPHYLW